MDESLRTYLDFAVETAYLAGRLTLGYFQSGVRSDLKPDDTPVTVADRQAEELIRGRITARWPGHAVVGEEYGVAGVTSESALEMVPPACCATSQSVPVCVPV